MLPCILFEDEHLLAVNKPAGMNTHAPAPHAGEGMYEWLRDREPRWASLAIIHRLDKETSGVLLFSKTPLANRSLTEEFTQRRVGKKYWLATDRQVSDDKHITETAIVRSGAKYLARPVHPGADLAKTHFCALAVPPVPFTSRMPGEIRWLEAAPATGRTHQIRVHAAHNGWPILGDALYGGTTASRLFLHAAELTLTHPATGTSVIIRAPLDSWQTRGTDLRSAIIDPVETDAYRLIHGVSDDQPGFFADKLAGNLLVSSARDFSAEKVRLHKFLAEQNGCESVWHKKLIRETTAAKPKESSPRRWSGPGSGEPFLIRENGLQYELSFQEGYSVGLFLDQRDNRRRLRHGYVASGFPSIAPNPGATLLNTFAYTCGFSVSAAAAGYQTTSLDLSRKYLDWGKRNFSHNHLNHTAHDFIFGDVIDWLARLARKGREFDVVVLDPPTFSQSKQSGVFRAQKDYEKLVAAALRVLKKPGTLFASTNAAGWDPEEFCAAVKRAIARTGRKSVAEHYSPQPPDFPISREEPAYLKTVWHYLGP